MDESAPMKPADPATPAAATDAGSPGTGAGTLSVKYLSDKLEEAELLLGYAAAAGIAVEDSVRDGVLKARIASDSGGVTKETADNLLTALTALAVDVRPVTVDSLKTAANPEASRMVISWYGTTAVVIGLIIVVSSMLTFASSSISEKIKTDIATANALGAKLRSVLGPSPVEDQQTASPAPAAGGAAAPSQDQVWYGTDKAPAGLSDKDVISDLAQFAATVREIDGYAKLLKYWSLDFAEPSYVKILKNAPANAAKPPENKLLFELTPGLNMRFAQELTDKVKEYQRVRNFGNSIQEKVTLFWGAFATFILPVLYAVLGADAYLLRMYEDQIRNRTLVAAGRHVARFMIAGIGGLVVGLFNNVTQGVSISPFAVAFLVGYAVDVFFAFLEGMLQIFKRGPGSSGAPGASSATQG